jgi:hypothetical protein
MSAHAFHLWQCWVRGHKHVEVTSIGDDRVGYRERGDSNPARTTFTTPALFRERHSSCAEHQSLPLGAP